MVATIHWTDEETAKLRELILEGGRTASQIGAEIGRPRNSVIGKALRLGLRLPGAVGPMGSIRLQKHREAMAKKSTRPPGPARFTQKPVQGLLPPKVQPYRDPEPTPRVATPRAGQSQFATCQWFFGDPRAGDFSKCDQPTVGSSSFCEHHHHRVYVPAQPKQPRKF